MKFLLKFLNYVSKGYSPCKIYQIEEFKKLKLKKKIIEFGTNYYEESFTKLIRNRSKQIFFSNIKKNNNKNYIQINLEKKNKINKKFENAIVFNVLEHVYDNGNALDQIKKILKKDGIIYISTPFIYRYHKATEDYNRYTIPYFEKILKEKNFKIIEKKNLGEGPFIASYSLLHDYLKRIPLISYPIVIICYLFDKILSLFHKKNIKKFYPICILIIAKKRTN